MSHTIPTAVVFAATLAGGSEAIAGHGLVEVMAGGGLAAALTFMMVKWILGQYQSMAKRLAEIEDRREAQAVQQAVNLEKYSESVNRLTEESRARGREVRELLDQMRSRPCIMNDENHERHP